MIRAVTEDETPTAPPPDPWRAKHGLAMGRILQFAEQLDAAEAIFCLRQLAVQFEARAREASEKLATVFCDYDAGEDVSRLADDALGALRCYVSLSNGCIQSAHQIAKDETPRIQVPGGQLAKF